MSTDLSAFKKNDRRVLKETSGSKGGRPPKDEAEKLTQKITVNFTPAEKEKLLERSKAGGRSSFDDLDQERSSRARVHLVTVKNRCKVTVTETCYQPG